MKMTNFAALWGNLFSMMVMHKTGGRTGQSDADCQNKILKDWYKKIDQMAKRRFPWDEALAMEAVNYILLERLPKECEKLLNQSPTPILLYFSHWLEDFARKKPGAPIPPRRCCEKQKRLLCGQVIQQILKRRLPKAQFNVAMVVETLVNEHPDVNREEIVKTVLAIKAYHLLVVHLHTRRETVEMLKGEVNVSLAMVEEVVCEILQKCPIRMSPIRVQLDEEMGIETEISSELSFEEQLWKEWLRRLGHAISVLLGDSDGFDDPEFQNLLNRLQSAQLTELEKRVLSMRYYHEMTAKEIADSEIGRQQGWTVRKVFVISDSALKKLRKVLQNYWSE